MSQKIYREVILQWNEKTNQYDTIYEDSYDYDGDVDLLQGPEEMADEFSEDFQPDFEDVSKSLTKALKNAGKKAAKGFGGNFEKSIVAGAQVAFDSLTKTGSAFLGKEYKDAAAILGQVLEGTLTGVSGSLDLRDAALEFGDTLREMGLDEKEIEKRLAPFYNLADKLELKEMESEFKTAVEDGLTNGLGGIPSNAFTQAIGLDAGITAAVAMFSRQFMAAGAKVGMFLKNNWKMALGIGLVLALFSALNAQASKFGDEFGAIGATEFRGELAQAEATAIGLGYEFTDLVTSIDTLTAGLGMGVDEAALLSESILDTAKATGLGVDNTAALFSTLVAVTGQSEETANNFIKQTTLLAKASNVAPKQVLADMAESSDEIAKYTKDTGENMVQAAVKAAQLGMTLSDVAGIADNLLDFQSSIQAEMTASAMTGKQLNLQRARELALAGDLAGLQDELVSQIGSEAQLNSMNVLQRQALADALGVSVAQMTKMAKMSGKTQDELMRMSEFDASTLVSDDAMGNINKMANQFKKIGYDFLAAVAYWLEENSDTVDSIVYGVTQFAKFLGYVLVLAGELHMVILAVAIVWASIKVFRMAEGMFKTLKAGKDLLKNLIMQRTVKKELDKAPPKTTTNRFGWVKGLNPKAMIKGAFAILILSGALFVAAKAFQQFNSVNWESVLFGLGALVVMGFVARMLGQGSAQMLMGALAVAVLGAALIPAAYAFSLLAGVDPWSIIAFAGALIVLAAATFVLGAIMFSGIGALVFGAGILALLALGGAMLVIGYAVSLAGPHMATFAENAGALATAMGVLIPLGPGMYTLGAAFLALGPPMLQSAYSAGMAAISYGLMANNLSNINTAVVDMRGFLDELNASFTTLKENLVSIRETLTITMQKFVEFTAMTGSIIGLSTALAGLATALSAVSIAGMAAMPVLGVLTALAPALESIGLALGGGNEDTGEGSMKDSLASIRADIKALLQGFQDGTFEEMIGKETGKNIKNLKAQISDNNAGFG